MDDIYSKLFLLAAFFSSLGNIHRNKKIYISKIPLQRESRFTKLP